MLRKSNVEQLSRAFLPKKFLTFMDGRRYQLTQRSWEKKQKLARPEIAQVLFKHNDKSKIGKDLEVKLYEARRIIEKEAIKSNLNNFYICSFSSKSIIYKGMFSAEALDSIFMLI